MIQSILHNLSWLGAVLWHGHAGLPVELTQLCLLKWLLYEVAKGILKSTELYFLNRFSQIQANLKAYASQYRWIMIQNMPRKQSKSLLRQWNELFLIVQVSHQVNTYLRMKTVSVKGLAKHLNNSQFLVTSMSFRLQVVTDCNLDPKNKKISLYFQTLIQYSTVSVQFK